MPRLRSASLLALVLALSPAGSRPLRAEPFLFPPTPKGPAEVRDERDVAPYLAAWKAASLERARLLAAPPTSNQLAYDVHFYDLNLTATPTTSQLSGTVRTRASVVSGPLSTVQLDFAANMVVDAVTSAGAATTWSRAGAILTVNLDRAYLTGETFDITVTYHGTPSGGYFGFNTANGRRLVWSLSEPFGARTWWPCKDHPEDKADSVDVRLSVPTGMITASNGRRFAATDNGVTSFAHWKERYPIATYLVSIASYPYATSQDFYRYTPTDSMPIQFFVFPETAPSVAAVHAKVKLMLSAFATRMGEYPFVNEKYGHAEFLFGGGMEHQTCTSLGAFSEFVVAHELGHQWWGDKVTCRDFHHIWLNEGFATYTEALWAEATGGPAAYQADIAINAFYGPGSVWCPDVDDESRIFDSNLSYDKGSWVLHMLRHVLGDSTFFDALREYGTLYAYSSATTEDFRDVCENVSGMDLDAFFQQWVYGEYYPEYRVTWNATPAAGGWDVHLNLEQTQSWQLFHMPLDVRVTTTGGTQTFVVRDSLAAQTFTLHVASQPTGLALDPDNWVLRTIDAPFSNPTFAKGVLLVNGVDWATYGTEITTAYTDQAFSGDYTVDFWDHFAEPAGGYPAGLPAPLGHGAVPADVIGQYRNVIWIGNDFNGDATSWINTPILSYLKAGGNVLLMTRQGDSFLTDSLRGYLGINFTQTGAQLYDCEATRPGLANLSLLGAQTLCVAFDTVRTRTDTQLLWKANLNYNPDRGLGVARIPPAGGEFRAQGGRFIFLSGRPYRWNHAQLKTNVMTLLLDWFLEPVVPVAVGDAPRAATGLALAAPRPNPFRSATVLRFTLPAAGPARVEILDAAGRRVRGLIAGPLAAGDHEASWDGRDDRGRLAAVGVYWARVAANGEVAAKKLVRVN